MPVVLNKRKIETLVYNLDNMEITSSGEPSSTLSHTETIQTIALTVEAISNQIRGYDRLTQDQYDTIVEDAVSSRPPAVQEIIRKPLKQAMANVFSLIVLQPEPGVNLQFN